MEDKPIIWLSGEVKTPPFSDAARKEAGDLLRALQHGEMLAMPHSRSMPSIGPRCHELRVQDESVTWRIIYRIDSDAILVLDVFQKKTQATPRHIIGICKRRLALYDSD
jgi:phage-related protein